MRDWTANPTFDGIDLSDSLILSWATRDHDLVVEVDFVLIEGHPDYHPPRSDEWACFRRGILRFVNLRSLTGLPPMATVIPATDATGEKDYGHFDSLVEDPIGHFAVSWDYGSFFVQSDPPKIEIGAGRL
jgi:hypothetical protein